jgi:hypothetical protein
MGSEVPGAEAREWTACRACRERQCTLRLPTAHRDSDRYLRAGQRHDNLQRLPIHDRNVDSLGGRSRYPLKSIYQTNRIRDASSLFCVLYKSEKGAGRHPIKGTPSASAAFESVAPSVASGCPLRSASSR